MCGIFAYLGTSVKKAVLDQEFQKLFHRGPDESRVTIIDNVYLGFHRLAIMDLTHQGMQPFIDLNSGQMLICNGEIYNYHQLYDKFKEGYPFHSHSDCEVILPLIQEFGLKEACYRLDGEFAFITYDPIAGVLKGARDPIGIRPLFYGYTKHEGEIAFASEAKALVDFCKSVHPFPPGHFFDGVSFIPYRSFSQSQTSCFASLESITQGIHDRLKAGVIKRLESDAPIGFLLSGGLDSSLVCAIAAEKLEQPIKTFAVGCRHDAIDIKYAEMVAEHIGSDHTNVYFTMDEVLEKLEAIIHSLETWDITTIRASIGMYLVCEHIKSHTDIKVLLTGEVSDELFGYKYTDYAPNSMEFQKEAEKRVFELHQYDVLRADRCMSAHSLEARVPFGDLDFVEYIMAIDPEVKMNKYGIGKYLLRRSFKDTNLLPENILFREKAAFSDAVGHSMVDEIKAYAEQAISDSELTQAAYRHGNPFTKESLFYRRIFEKFFPGRAGLIKDFWLPNQDWQNCQVKEPSARALPNYGKSGK